ncbi:MAG: hypothetical protein ACF8MF_03085 [Phycisphaerales bacterium JB052]
MNTQNFFAAAAGVAMLGSMANADMVSFFADPNSTTNGTPTGVSLNGTVEYSYTSGSVGQVVFSMTNTTSSSIGGFLTGMVFNIDSIDSGASATLSSTSDSDFKDTGAEAANPFGTYDAGAALKSNWTGGGNPSKGIGVGISSVFTFTVNASDAASLSAMSFIGDGSDIALRFRGLNNDGSDKLQVTTEDPALNVVPLPTSVWAGGAMLGLGLGVRRLRK